MFPFLRRNLGQKNLRSRLDGASGRVLKNSGWLVLAQGLVALLTLVQGVLITRVLGIASYGVFALVVTVVLTVIQLCDSRIWETLIKFVPQYRSAGDAGKATAVVQFCFLLQCAAGLAAFAFLTVAAPYVSSLLVKDPAATHLVRLYALLALLTIPEEPISGLLRVADRFGHLACQQATVAVLKVLGTVAVCLTTPTIERLLLVQLAATACGACLLAAMVYRAGRALELQFWRTLALGRLRGHYREIIRFATLTNLTATSRMFSMRADTLVLGLLATPASVGAYDLAKKLVNQFGILFNPLYAAVYPEMARLMAGGHVDEVRRLQSQLSRLTLAVVVPGCVVGTLAAPWVIPLIFGRDFTASVPLFQVLVWQSLWLVLVWLPGYLLLIGRVSTVTMLTWVDTLIYAVLLLVLTPLGGSLGAAWATTLRQFNWSVMAFTVYRGLGKKESLPQSTDVSRRERPQAIPLPALVRIVKEDAIHAAQPVAGH